MGVASSVPKPTTLGRYRLVRRIARGGMGEVYLAWMNATGGVRRPVAVKVLSEARPNQQTALFAEARLAALIAHPNVVQLFDAGADGELAWFAMEYVPGLPLSDVLEFGNERVPPWIWARIIADACGALHAVHEARDGNWAPLNVVHRDVTPQNLLLSWDGIVKLVDFGIARSALLGSQTTTGVVKGKVGYMSPEQAGGATLDRRSDVFALGVILWEALAGRRLFHRGTEAETIATIVRCDVPPLGDVVQAVPGALAAVAARALLPSAGARFATAQEMKRALEVALNASGFVVGTNEVAHVLAAVAPERQRAQERWLAEESETDTTSAASLAARELTRRLAGASQDSGARPFPRTHFGAGVALGTGISAAVFAMLRDPPAQPTLTPAAAISQPSHSADAWGIGQTVSSPVLEAGNSLPTPAPGPIASVAKVRTQSSKPPVPPMSARPQAGSTAPGTLRVAPGTLHVAAKPTWATVHLDGQPIGSTPLVVPDVAPGPHVLQLSAEGHGPTRERAIVVRAGATERIEVSLE